MADMQSFEFLKLWLKRTLTGFVGLLALESLACLVVILLALGASGGDIDGGQAQVVEACLMLIAVCAIVELIFNIAIVVLFLRLLYKAVQQARGFTPPFTYVSPGWAVGYWFIPLMNLYRPFQVMQAWFKACAEQPGSKLAAGEQVLNAWWAMFLLSNIAGWIVAKQDTDMGTVQGILTYAGYTLGSNLLFIVASFLFWIVIQRMVTALAPSTATSQS